MVSGESEQYPTIEGSILNYRYQIDRILNDKGGMGLIYLATDLNLRGTVVLKKSRFVDEQSRSAFEREARLLYGLRHNALPRVIDYFVTEDQSQYFVMEFIPGKDLSELLSLRIERGEGPFPMDQVLDWGEQLLDALHYLHTHEPPIIHRDIKPQNLKLMPNGQIILLDFGLAKGSVGGMTMGVSIQGYTPNYAPLEQMRGSGTDARSDIYSLAVTLHCLLSGQMPPDAVSRAIETLSAQPDPLRAVHDINRNIPSVVSETLQKACSLNQNERPQTAALMRDMVRRARASLLSGKTGSSQKQPATTSAKPAVSQAPPASIPVKAVPLEIKTQPSALKVKPPIPPPVVVSSVVAASNASNGSTPQERNANEEAKPPVEKAETGPATSNNGKSVPSAENQFVMAFAPVRTVAPNRAVESTPVRKSGAPPTPVERGMQPPHSNGDAVKAPSGVIPEHQARPGAIPVAEVDGNPINQAPLPRVVPEKHPEGKASVIQSETPSTASETRATSIVVIEHLDEGKAGVNGNGHKPASSSNMPAGRIPAASAEIETPKLSAQPAVERRVVMPELANVAAPAPPTPPPMARNYDSDSLKRARDAADLLDKPRQVGVNQRKERPREEEFLLPSVEPEPSVKPVTVATPSGLRSFTEVIGFGVRLEMHAIPGGEFLMGSPEKRGYADEFPQHKVALSPFYIGRYPVTQKQYRAVMRTNPSSYLEDSHPVETVTWDEAVEFCRRLTIATGRIYRLPTEAEWEYACRAGTTTRFNFGDDEEMLNQYGWNLTNSGNHTHPVGEKKPNGWGLCDMHGNVWEWCLDWYDQMYYLQSPAANPNGPTKGTSRVLRGGSRYSLPNYCRNATRSNHQPDQRDPLVGFRVVCEARELPG